MNLEEFETERLILRKLTPEIYKWLYENLNDDEIQNYLGLNSQEELEKEKEKYKRGLSTYNRSFVNFKIFDKETKKHIGNCGFHTWSVDHFRDE